MSSQPSKPAEHDGVLVQFDDAQALALVLDELGQEAALFEDDVAEEDAQPLGALDASGDVEGAEARADTELLAVVLRGDLLLLGIAFGVGVALVGLEEEGAFLFGTHLDHAAGDEARGGRGGGHGTVGGHAGQGGESYLLRGQGRGGEGGEEEEREAEGAHVGRVPGWGMAQDPRMGIWICTMRWMSLPRSPRSRVHLEMRQLGMASSRRPSQFRALA